MPLPTCPVSGNPLTQPVIIYHPNFALVIYDRSTVARVVRNGHLASYGIYQNNYRDYLRPIHFLNDLALPFLNAAPS